MISKKNIIENLIMNNFQDKNNFRYKFITGCNFLMELYKIINSCFLSVSVAQSCYSDKLSKHLCTFYENIDGFYLYENNIISIFNNFVIYYNLFCFLCFIYLYYVELHRENWLSKYFIHDKEYKEYYLDKYKEKYNTLFNKLNTINNHYFLIYKILFTIYLTNVILSGIFIFNYQYLDEKTTITFMTNISLSWIKIFTGLTIANTSSKYNIPISYYHLYNLVFNDINIIYKYENDKLKSESFEEYRDLIEIDKLKLKEHNLMNKKLSILSRIETNKYIFKNIKLNEAELDDIFTKPILNKPSSKNNKYNENIIIANDDN
jgi:hypothetical protein